MNVQSQSGDHLKFDVLVIGGGISGLSFILELAHQAPKVSIALIMKANRNETNSHYAQGGIAAVAGPEDNLDLHLQDTLSAGDGLCHIENTQRILSQGPNAIRSLLSYGVEFDKHSGEGFALAKEGGHCCRRIYHHGDKTGFHIMEKLQHHISALQNLHLFEGYCALNLITRQLTHQPGAPIIAEGAYVLEEATGLIHAFSSKAVILATGGAGKTYRYTSNPEVATGDGLAMAYRAGARVGNMEFYQFHPTLLYHPTVNNFLISEALRGEGAVLRRAHDHSLFMSDYAPQQKELATRDIVARAIFNEIERDNQNHVYLDITHRPRAFLKKHFPQIFQQLSQIGIDMSQDYIPVVPAAHYQCGGILTDYQGLTDIKNLYAIGEVAYTGLHGANRLASNSLLEAVVVAKNAASHCLHTLDEYAMPSAPCLWSSNSVVNFRRASQINAHWRGLRGEMTSYAGIVRTQAGLSDLLQLIKIRKKIVEEYYWQHLITRDLIELRNIITNAELITQSALRRRASCGVHFREDLPLNESSQRQFTPCSGSHAPAYP